MFDEEYFDGLLTTIAAPFPSDSDREMFVSNISENFHETEFLANALKCRASIKVLCWVLQQLDDEQFKAICMKIELTFFDFEFPFTFDVLRTIFSSGLKRYLKAEDQHEWLIQYIQEYAMFVYEDIEEFKNNTDKNRYIHLVFELCCGFDADSLYNSKSLFNLIGKTPLQEAMSKHVLIKQVPSALSKLAKVFAKEYSESIEDSEMIASLKQFPLTYQYILIALKMSNNTFCKTFIKKILNPTLLQRGKLESLLTESKDLRILEYAINFAEPSYVLKIWSDVFVTNLTFFLEHPYANHLITRIIESANDQESFVKIFKDLCPNIELINQKKRTNIVIALALKCQHFPSTQEEFLKTIFELVPNDGNIVSFFSIREETIWVGGANIIESLIQFKDTTKLAKAFTNCPADDLVKIAQHQSGSYMLENFLKAPKVDQKCKDMFAQSLKGSYTTLICNRFGSFLIPNVIENCSNNVKRLVMDELDREHNKLKFDRCAGSIFKQIGFDCYKKRPRDWEEVQRSSKKKREIMQDFVNKRR